MKREDCMAKLKTHREKLPRTLVERVLRLAGLDDGRHLGECEQFERDARLYPGMEAAALGWSYLPQETAGELARYVAEEMGLVEGPTYCRVCGTRERKAFDLRKSADACASCYDECGPPEPCARCGKATYEGDWYGAYVWTALAAQEGKCSAAEVGQPVPESDEMLLLGGQARREGWVEWKNREYRCDGCMDAV